MPRDDDGGQQEAQPEPKEEPRATNPRSRLQQLLAPHIELLEMGIPAREVEALIRTDEPRFSPKKLGFEDFTALLDFAEAEELLRSIPDDRNLLRFKPGDSLTVPVEAEEPKAAEETVAESSSAAPRRRRRRNASRLSTGDEGAPEDISKSADEAPPIQEPADEEPEPVRKKAAKRKTAKKSVKKTAKKKVAKRASTDESDDNEA